MFLPTSDDYFWIKKHLINQQDMYFSRELIKADNIANITSSGQLGDGITTIMNGINEMTPAWLTGNSGSAAQQR